MAGLVPAIDVWGAATHHGREWPSAHRHE